MALDSRIDVLNDLGMSYWQSMPTAFQNSPDHLAVLNAQTKELARVEATIEAVRSQFFPQTADILLKVWEAQLGITIEPSGQTVDQRRNTVIAFLRKLAGTPSGLDWIANVVRLIGVGWDYEEHVPGDALSPPADTLRISLPFPPASSLYRQVEGLIRDITPAHVDLIVTFSGGFLLDESQLDQEELQ